MKKRRLKPSIKISIITFSLFLVLLLTFVSLSGKTTKKVYKENSEYTYVNDYIFDNYYPVIGQDEKIIKPFNSDKISIYKKFYEKDSTNEEQQNSIIYHDGIYMQNSGVDYKSDEIFDVLSVTSGTVTNIIDDSLLGKTIEIKSSNELSVTYQSLSEINVKKGDIIQQGKVIGKSGACNLNGDIKNGLHIEMYMNGSVINPEKYYGKSLKDLTLKN